MILSAVVNDEQVSVGESKDGSEYVAIIVKRGDEESERITMHGTTFAALVGLVGLYLDEATDGEDDS